MNGASIRVAVVDDEALARELHTNYLERIQGFSVVACYGSARETVVEVLKSPGEIDLLLLDMTMPGGSGLDALRALRSRGSTVDVIAITAVADAAVVQQMVGLGVNQYLIKPASFAQFADRLERFREFFERTRGVRGIASQSEVDALLAARSPAYAPVLPKGLSAETLDLVCATLRDSTGEVGGAGLTAAELGNRIGISRVTARRYLEHLGALGTVERSSRHGAPGRPRVEYRWKAARRVATPAQAPNP